MTPERYNRIIELFGKARQHEPDARKEFVFPSCKGDDDLRREVEAMLVAAEHSSHFLETPPDYSLVFTSNNAQVAPVMESTPTTGTVIGPYHLLGLIGTGGMGEVWLAEQKSPVRRRVALKLIKAGMDPREVVARFEAERQALALMNHPDIAQVLDVGSTAQGHPFFVMEFVTGMPITSTVIDID